MLFGVAGGDVVSLPAAWTDAVALDPFVVAAAGHVPFRTADLPAVTGGRPGVRRDLSAGLCRASLTRRDRAELASLLDQYVSVTDRSPDHPAARRSLPSTVTSNRTASAVKIVHSSGQVLCSTMRPPPLSAAHEASGPLGGSGTVPDSSPHVTQKPAVFMLYSCYGAGMLMANEGRSGSQ